MTFTIEKGKHYSDRFFHKLFNLVNFTSFNTWTIIFDESCQYELLGPDQYDVNKLIGFSIGANHHKESARFGWRSVANEIEISAYAYVNSKRIIEPIAKVPLNTNIDLFLDVEQHAKPFAVAFSTGPHVETKIPKITPFAIGYSLWPYFGGNCPAPHKMKMEIFN